MTRSSGPGPWFVAPVAESDYWMLCLACGAITHEPTWTYWQRPDSDDWQEGDWRPSLPSEGDPMMRCPACAWEHVDDDSNPGICDGTRLEVTRQRHQLADDYADLWIEMRAGTSDTRGSSKPPASESANSHPGGAA